MPPVFVTSSGTEIGKTYVSVMLTRELKARALKPLVSGLDEETFPGSDPAMLLAAMGEAVLYENAGLVSRWRFKAALSPDMAARLRSPIWSRNALRPLRRTAPLSSKAWAGSWFRSTLRIPFSTG